jgi:hypothetical protein
MTGYCRPFFIQHIADDTLVWNLAVVNKIWCGIHVEIASVDS